MLSKPCHFVGAAISLSLSLFFFFFFFFFFFLDESVLSKVTGNSDSQNGLYLVHRTLLKTMR